MSMGRRDTMRMKQLNIFDVACPDCEPVSLVFMSRLDLDMTLG
jgi:ribosomal protein S27E